MVSSETMMGFKTTSGKPDAATPAWPAQFNLSEKLSVASDPVDLMALGA